MFACWSSVVYFCTILDSVICALELVASSYLWRKAVLSLPWPADTRKEAHVKAQNQLFFGTLPTTLQRMRTGHRNSHRQRLGAGWRRQTTFKQGMKVYLGISNESLKPYNLIEVLL